MVRVTGTGVGAECMWQVMTWAVRKPVCEADPGRTPQVVDLPREELAVR